MTRIPAWLDGARLAPSRFNTQPWLFQPQANGDVVVGWDPARVLSASDPTGRDLFLCLGAAVESACLQAMIAGQSMGFVPAGSDEPRVVGRLTTITAEDDRAGKRLASYLGERHTARARHLQLPVPPVVQLALRRETVGWACRLHLATEADAIHQLAAVLRRATFEQYQNDATRAEMAAWYHLNSAEEDATMDGMSSQSLELSGRMLVMARWALANGKLSTLRRRFAAPTIALREWSIARHSAAFCLLTTQSTEREDMVRAGRLLIRLWLLAAEAGLSVQALSPMLHSDVLAERCLHIFKAQGTVPACVFRLGFCPPGAPSSRLPAARLLDRSHAATVSPSSITQH